MALSPIASTTASAAVPPAFSRTSRTAATAAATRPGSEVEASSTSHTPSGRSGSSSRPARSARRVLPHPPGPVSVSNAAERCSSTMRASSSSRPTKEVSSRGRLWSRVRPEGGCSISSSSAARTSAIPAGRSSGSFARQRPSSSRTRSGVPAGRRLHSGSARSTAACSSAAPLPAKARRPARHSNRRQPKAKMSDRGPAGSPRACSGLRYPGVPRMSPARVRSRSEGPAVAGSGARAGGGPGVPAGAGAPVQRSGSRGAGPGVPAGAGPNVIPSAPEASRPIVRVSGSAAAPFPRAPSGSARVASPKSSTFTCPSSPAMTFAGFRSRCTTPRACAASSAFATLRPICSASGPGIGPRRIRSARLSPSMCSITR